MVTITTCMILAAGKGTRLRPYTSNVPKPMVEVAHKPALEHVLNNLQNRGITKLVINTCYKADPLEQYLKNAPFDGDIIISREPECLETGGGIKFALPHLGSNPFLVINSDAMWREDTTPLLPDLCQNFDMQRMDALLALVPKEKTKAFRMEGGDFCQRNNGSIYWPENRADANWVYMGVHVTHPAFIAFDKEKRFPLTKPWRDAEAVKRLYGHTYNGDWVDMGSHSGLASACTLMHTT